MDIIYIYKGYIHIFEVVFYSIVSLHLNDFIILSFSDKEVIILTTKVKHTILRSLSNVPTFINYFL